MSDDYKNNKNYTEKQKKLVGMCEKKVLKQFKP